MQWQVERRKKQWWIISIIPAYVRSLVTHLTLNHWVRHSNCRWVTVTLAKLESQFAISLTEINRTEFTTKVNLRQYVDKKTAKNCRFFGTSEYLDSLVIVTLWFLLFLENYKWASKSIGRKRKNIEHWYYYCFFFLIVFLKIWHPSCIVQHE